MLRGVLNSEVVFPLADDCRIDTLMIVVVEHLALQGSARVLHSMYAVYRASQCVLLFSSTGKIYLHASQFAGQATRISGDSA